MFRTLGGRLVSRSPWEIGNFGGALTALPYAYTVTAAYSFGSDACFVVEDRAVPGSLSYFYRNATETKFYAYVPGGINADIFKFNDAGAVFCPTVELGTLGTTDTTLARSSAGNVSVEGNVLYRAGGTDVTLADGGTGASLTDPNIDLVMGWDDSAGAVKFMTASDINTEATPASGDFLLMYDAAGNLLKTDWVNLPSGGGTAATQADQETATSTTTFVSPGRQHFHPSASKCWGFTTGGATPSLTASYNVTSITDFAVGLLTVTIATDFSSANYVVVSTVADASTGNIRASSVTSKAAGSVQIRSMGSTALTDPSIGQDWAMFGDQ